MKKIQTITLLAIMANFLTNPAIADSKRGSSHDAHNHNEMKAIKGNKQAKVKGVINKINAAQKQLNVTHEPVKELGWPKMTMDLPVTSKIDLSKLKQGDKIDFILKQGRDKKFRIIKVMKQKAHDHHDHAEHNHSHHNHSHADLEGGEPGKKSEVSRTIKITASDEMKFSPFAIEVKDGETIRFIVTNKGEMAHDFTIGTPKMQLAHQKEMAKMMNDASHSMEHNDPNALYLKSGETKELIWKFKKTAKLEIGCNVPGHYQAGMKGQVTFKK